MQQELDGLMDLPESELMEQDTTVVEEDPELEAETARKKLDVCVSSLLDIQLYLQKK